jgi:hypothetical protein
MTFSTTMLHYGMLLDVALLVVMRHFTTPPCHYPIIISVIILSVIILIVFMLSVKMLSVIMLIVIRLRVNMSRAIILSVILEYHAEFYNAG